MGDFPDTSEFEGEVRHSHTYRVPEPYQGKTVLISGGGPSGIDISYDLATVATKVTYQLCLTYISFFCVTETIRMKIVTVKHYNEIEGTLK